MIWKILSLNLLLLFTSSSALLENLYQRESSCYSGCRSNYADQTSYADACKKGCDYKLHNEKCADQCSLVSSDPQLQASCLVGCSMVDSMKPQEVEPSLGDRPRSIILIRLRQRPLLQLPSFDKDPAEFFRDMIKQMSSGASGELKTVIHLTKNIPLIKLPDGPIRADSSSESSEEMGGHMKHFVIFRQGHQQPVNGRLQQITDSLKREWKDLIHRQPNVPIWLLLLFFLSLSALLWYMIVSLCSHAPTHRTLSIRAQELLTDSVEEKEKLQPHEHYVEVYPVKEKLSHI